MKMSAKVIVVLMLVCRTPRISTTWTDVRTTISGGIETLELSKIRENDLW